MSICDKVKHIIDMRIAKTKKKVILNQPIENEEQDWIGVSVYVDKLEAAIKAGAHMIGITSDFGAGKSSIVNLYIRRIKNRSFPRNIIHEECIYTINLWSTLENTSNDEIQTIDLHRAFLFNLISQINPYAGSYISKRFNKSYGLFKIQAGKMRYTFFSVMGIVAIFIEEMFRKFPAWINEVFSISEEYCGRIQFFSGIIGLFLILFVITKADFLFSFTKSQGQRTIDENIIIDYFRSFVLNNGFGRHYILVIEDLDRTNDIDSVVTFLKEIQKYYIVHNVKNLHRNKVTFVFNLKPEALLRDEKRTSERLYEKFFDYIITLKKINIDDYDVILEGLLNEYKTILIDLGLVKENENVTIQSIKGMQWIVRGKSLDLRCIKERLSNALVLYETLRDKFGDKIEFEKAAVATYVCSEFEDEFYKLRDKDFDSLIEMEVAGELDNNSESWAERGIHISNTFGKEIVLLIENKHIDTTYRTYFYNYPKDSHLFDVKEMYIYNALLFQDASEKSEKFEQYLQDCEETPIVEALEKRHQLAVGFSNVVLRHRKLLEIVVKEYYEEYLDIIRHMLFDEKNMRLSISNIERMFKVDADGKILTKEIAKDLCDIWNENAAGEGIGRIRRKIIDILPDLVLQYADLFVAPNDFINEEEVERIGVNNGLLQLIDYSNLPKEMSVCEKIHDRILEQPEITAEEFYLNIVKQYGIENVAPLIFEYCQKYGDVSEAINEVVETGIVSKDISAEEYIGIINWFDVLAPYLVEMINNINWYGGLKEKHCQKLYDEGYYFCYFMNMMHGNVEKINLHDDYIREAIKENRNIIFKNIDVWKRLRIEILKLNGERIKGYNALFSLEYPMVTLEELRYIDDIEIALYLMSLNVVTENNVNDLIAYLNSNYQDAKKTNLIYRWIITLDKGKFDLLFYKLDQKKVPYRRMSQSNQRDILASLMKLLRLENAENQIRFMKYIRSPMMEFEKDILKEIENGEIEEKDYVECINAYDKNYIRATTINNIAKLKYYYVFSEAIEEMLFSKEYYKFYIYSVMKRKNVFLVDDERKSQLWDAYVAMFHRDADYVKLMQENKKFVEELVEKEEYKKAGESLKNYSCAAQSVGLLEEVFKTEIDDIIDYCAQLSGFDSYESAKYFVDCIVRKPKLLKNQSVYDNTYEKLLDGPLKSRYTKARKKLLQGE